MEKNNVYIIIINYKNYDDTKECIESLKHINDMGYHIVVVDNDSKDGSKQRLKENFENLIEVIENDHNYGFGIANNIGAQYAINKGATHILLLNNDTTVDPMFLSNLMKKINDQTICVPKILSYYDRNKVWYAGGRIDRIRGTSLHYGRFKEDSDFFSTEKKVNYLTGCCALIPVSVIDRIGLFGDEFFLYFEDMDLSIKCLYEGIEILYVPDSVIYHKEGKSSGGKKSKSTVYYANRNRFYIIRKYNRYFGLISHIYTYATRFLLYLYGIIDNNNYRIIKKAYGDYKSKKMGESNI